MLEALEFKLKEISKKINYLAKYDGNCIFAEIY